MTDPNRLYPPPGASPNLSSEGIIYGTDRKCRWVYELPSRFALLGDSPRCLLFTLDETAISCQQVKGRVRKEEVTHAFAVWVGGQSQPALRFHAFEQVALAGVRRIIPNSAKNRIDLRGPGCRLRLYADSQQFNTVLEHLRGYCPQAAQTP